MEKISTVEIGRIEIFQGSQRTIGLELGVTPAIRRRSALKKALTQPILLEMSDSPIYRNLARRQMIDNTSKRQGHNHAAPKGPDEVDLISGASRDPRSNTQPGPLGTSNRSPNYRDRRIASKLRR
jgi:hypothetical protein